MKRLLMLLAASVVAFAVACSPEGDDSLAVLTLTTESPMRFGQNGGEGVINYTLQNAPEGATIKAVCADSWLTITEVANSVKFTVAANDTPEERMTMVLISYAQQSHQVVIEQQGAPDKEFVATMLNGKFYGKDNNPNAYQYAITLSKYGTTNATDYYADDCYYQFNIYSMVPAMSDPYLPWGEYNFDATNSGNAGTFSEDGSGYVEVDSEGKATHLRIIGGRVVVTEGVIDVLVTLSDNSVHHVIYNGTLNIYYLLEVSKGPFSTLEEDYTFNIEDGYMMLLYDGDDYGVGRGSWELRFMEDAAMAEGAFFRFPVMVEGLEFDRSVLYTTFTADKDGTFATGTYLPGYKLNGNLYGSWYLPLANGGFGYIASAIADGSVDVKLDGEFVVVTVDVVDDRGTAIKGTCRVKSTNISEYDRTSM